MRPISSIRFPGLGLGEGESKLAPGCMDVGSPGVVGKLGTEAGPCCWLGVEGISGDCWGAPLTRSDAESGAAGNGGGKGAEVVSEVLMQDRQTS